jgi:hypothetical protein
MLHSSPHLLSNERRCLVLQLLEPCRFSPLLFEDIQELARQAGIRDVQISEIADLSLSTQQRFFPSDGIEDFSGSGVWVVWSVRIEENKVVFTPTLETTVISSRTDFPELVADATAPILPAAHLVTQTYPLPRGRVCKLPLPDGITLLPGAEKYVIQPYIYALEMLGVAEQYRQTVSAQLRIRKE